MDDIIDKLSDLENKIDHMSGMDDEVMIDVKDKLSLYIKKFLNPEYLVHLNSIDFDFNDSQVFINSRRKLKSLISTLKEDLELSRNKAIFYSAEGQAKLRSEAIQEAEKEREKILADTKKQAENINNEALKIQALREEIEADKARFIEEEAKFNEVRKGVELTEKTITFQDLAEANKRQALIWAILSGVLISSLLWLLYKSLDNYDSFLNITELIN